jgi:quinol monooxygenase YgiN
MPKTNEVQIICVAEFYAKEGKIDELIDALHPLMQPTHKEPGCLRYELNHCIDDRRRVTFIEKWKNRTVFDQHCATPYVTRFFDELRPALAESFEVKLYHEILP